MDADAQVAGPALIGAVVQQQPIRPCSAGARLEVSVGLTSGPRIRRPLAADDRCTDVGQRRAELLARADPELSEHLAQVPLHRARTEEQLGPDLRVRLPAGSQARDLHLLRSQLVERLDGALTDCLAGGQQLAAGALGERLHAHVREHRVSNPDAVYRINIDTNGDNHADIAFSFTFSAFENGRQTGTAWYATGSQAREPEPSGEQLTASLQVSFDGTVQPVQAGPIRLFAGLRSDPFFADVEGALHGFAWTGHDDFADNNVDSIALEVPDDMLGAGPVIGVWASISLRRDGTLVQMDRGGNPTINPFINPDGEKNLFNSRQPADDVANYLGPWSKILENAGGYSPGEAKAAALQVLPDILHYDRTKPADLPQRPHPHRRRLQHPLRLAEQRQDPPGRPQATRRPAARLPLHRRP